MKYFVVTLMLILISCSTKFLILDDVNDAKTMGFRVVGVDTLDNGLLRVWVKE